MLCSSIFSRRRLTRWGGPDYGIDGWLQPAEDWAAALVTDGKEAGGTLGKNGRTASMNRVASLERIAKRMQGCDA